MSQHTDQHRPKRLARRAATVSAGAFALCLAGASPALADLGPIPAPDLGPVTDTVSPVTDAVDPVVPVSTTVQQIEGELGLANSVTSSPTPASPTPTTVDSPTQTRSGTRHHAADRSRDTQPQRLPGPAAVSPAYVPDWNLPAGQLPGLRSVTTATAAADAEAPAVAGQPGSPAHRVITLAGGAIQDLGDPATPMGRTLLIIVSTLAIGTLAGGHVKAAQDRLAHTA
jgi:hypothetical protein